MSESDADRLSRFAFAKDRLQILHRLERALEAPMIILGGVWLILMVLELGWSLAPGGARLVNAIWIIFILDFLLRFSLAPRKLAYLRRNWLTAIALVLPAVRTLRMLRMLRLLRGLRLVRIVSSVNRSMKALGKTMRRRGFGYVVALTVIVTLAGAAGMLNFERQVPHEAGLHDFWSALWWTAMMMTTMGSEYWPRTPEGRALGLFLAVYAFAVFGYVTGTIATYFIGRDAEEERSSASKDGIAALQAEIRALREEVRSLRARD
ncbi:MAG TPA: potassium channel family protein [Noviherbaspirillum sp.]|nr:potassium channel family protein [Noviherbaspirillum sp.]